MHYIFRFFFQTILFLFNGLQLQACTCNSAETLKAAIKEADFVAVVTAIDVTTEKITARRNKKGQSHISNAYRFRVAVEHNFKGKISKDTIVIYSEISSCGFYLRPGMKFIIYGNRRSYFRGNTSAANALKGKNIYWTHKCTGTKLYDEKEAAEIRKLRKI